MSEMSEMILADTFERGKLSIIHRCGQTQLVINLICRNNLTLLTIRVIYDHALKPRANPAKGVENHVPTIETATDKTT